MKKDLGTGYTIEGFDSVNPGAILFGRWFNTNF